MRFLANMSHEVRTPLNGIVGLTDLLKETSPTNEQSELLRALTRSSEHLLSIVNDILDMAKVNSGKMSLSRTAFDLASLIDDVGCTHARDGPGQERAFPG